jgi:hypothetical protein
VTAAIRITRGEVEAVIAQLPPEQGNLIKAYLQQLEGTIETLERILDDGE